MTTWLDPHTGREASVERLIKMRIDLVAKAELEGLKLAPFWVASPLP